MLLQKEELEQKHLHLVQIVESEKTAKWQYTQQCEELTVEIKKLRAELCALKKEWRLTPNRSEDEDSEEIKKIKKVQSFFRGWLCRRRWKQIVAEYISSPHAENMRKRNSLVFRMVEAEEEYVEQLQLLVSCFLRPFKMAASSQKPPCTHDEVNSIFLNSETLMFLHQIFLKGLTARMESWPTLVLATLFFSVFSLEKLFILCFRKHTKRKEFNLRSVTKKKFYNNYLNKSTKTEVKTMAAETTIEVFLTSERATWFRYLSGSGIPKVVPTFQRYRYERGSGVSEKPVSQQFRYPMKFKISEDPVSQRFRYPRGCITGVPVFYRFWYIRSSVRVVKKKYRNKIRSKTFLNKGRDFFNECSVLCGHLYVILRVRSAQFLCIACVLFMHKHPVVPFSPLRPQFLEGTGKEQHFFMPSCVSVSSFLWLNRISPLAASQSPTPADSQASFPASLGVPISRNVLRPYLKEKKIIREFYSICLQGTHDYVAMMGIVYCQALNKILPPNVARLSFIVAIKHPVIFTRAFPDKIRLPQLLHSVSPYGVPQERLQARAPCSGAHLADTSSQNSRAFLSEVRPSVVLWIREQARRLREVEASSKVGSTSCRRGNRSSSKSLSPRGGGAVRARETSRVFPAGNNASSRQTMNVAKKKINNFKNTSFVNGAKTPVIPAFGYTSNGIFQQRNIQGSRSRLRQRVHGANSRAGLDERTSATRNKNYLNKPMIITSEMIYSRLGGKNTQRKEEKHLLKKDVIV
ncbi:unnamed protein product [Ixodes persulcatus]